MADILNGQNGVFFKRGSYENYTKIQNKDANTLYITTDEGGIYLGSKRLGDYILVNSVDDLANYAVKSTGALYYAQKENVLARWNGSGWVQINAAGLRKVVQGEGDIVTSVSVDESADGTERVVSVTRELLAENATFKGVADRVASAEQKIAALVGETVPGKTLADQIAEAVAPAMQAAEAADAKAQGAVNVNDQQQVAIETLQGDMEEAQGAIATVDSRISTAKTEILGAGHTGTVKEAAAAAKAAQDDVDALEGEHDLLKARVQTNENNIQTLQGQMTTLNGDVNTAGSVDNKIALEVAKILNDADPSDIDTLEEIAAWIANDTIGVAGINQTLGQHTAQIGTLNTNVTNLQTAVSTTLPADIAKVKTDLTGTATTYTNLGKVETELGEILADVQDHETRIGVLEVAKDNHAGRIEAVEGKVATVDSRIATAKTELLGEANYNGTIKGAYEAAATAQGEVDALENLHSALDARVGTNETNIENLQNTVSTHLVWGTF